MNCKSCATELHEHMMYCPQCGGKIVENRLSLKGTWNEFIDPFFSWDNFFIKALFLHPETVFDAYIQGARRKYYKPFSLLILYGTIAVILNKLFSSYNAQIVASGIDVYIDTLSLKIDHAFLAQKRPKITTFINNFLNNINLYIVASVPFQALLFKKYSK